MAAIFYEGITTSVCQNESNLGMLMRFLKKYSFQCSLFCIRTFHLKFSNILEPGKWLPEICKDICTINATYFDCKDDGNNIFFSLSDGTVAIFPMATYRFSGCAECYNLSYVNIKCSLKTACMENRNRSDRPENTKKEIDSIDCKLEPVSMIKGNFSNHSLKLKCNLLMVQKLFTVIFEPCFIIRIHLC